MIIDYNGNLIFYGFPQALPFIFGSGTISETPVPDTIAHLRVGTSVPKMTVTTTT